MGSRIRGAVGKALDTYFSLFDKYYSYIAGAGVAGLVGVTAYTIAFWDDVKQKEFTDDDKEHIYMRQKLLLKKFYNKEQKILTQKYLQVHKFNSIADLSPEELAAIDKEASTRAKAKVQAVMEKELELGKITPKV